MYGSYPQRRGRGSVGVGYPIDKISAKHPELPKWLLHSISVQEDVASVDRAAFATQMWLKGYGRHANARFGLPVTVTEDTVPPKWVETLYNTMDPFWQDPRFPERLQDRNYAIQNPLFSRTQHTSFTPLAPIKAIASVTEDVLTAPAKALAAVTSQIPVVGDVTRIMSEATSSPIHLASQIAQGANVSKATLGYVKEQIKVVKDAAPYAQTVISLVPGVGPGVSAAMSAGIALAEGKSINEIAKAAIRGALPGGPLAQAAFDTALKVAAGGNVAKSVLEGARAALPPEAQKAFDIGLAVATGENIQNAVVAGVASLLPAQLQALAATGEKAAASVPGMSDVLKSITAAGGSAADAAKNGFNLASGLLSQAGANEKAVSALRDRLTSDQVKGFDAALQAQEKKLAWLGNIIGKPAGATAKATQPVRQPPALKAPPKAVPKTAPPPMRAPPVKAPVKAPVAAAVVPTPATAKLLTAKPVTKSAAATPSSAKAATATIASMYPPYPASRQAGVLGGCGEDPASKTWGPPITDMDGGMAWAGRSAVNGSKGRPRMVEGPGGITYLFAMENGALTARREVT